jgi:hypothetical protein
LKIKRYKWWIVAGLVILIKVFSLNKHWVEQFYSNGVYSYVAWILRLITGWVPISIGDILYLVAALWLVWKLVKFIQAIVKKRLRRGWLKRSLLKGLYYLLVIYLVFNIAWGLNYNREGAASRLGLNTEKYHSTELKMFCGLLLDRVNSAKQDWMQTDQPYPNSREMFERSASIYDQAKQTYPFLEFSRPSIKSSMYSLLGSYFGFAGYYNPFSGEAQINTMVPVFTQPFTAAHEVAHQIGYAKENEASFVAYLAISASNDELFKYSCYFDMFVFARRELYQYDSTAAKELTNQLIPEARKDYEEWRAFALKYKNPVEPMVRWAYGYYLKMNDQPQGILTYDEVIGNLISFYRKFGKI